MATGMIRPYMFDPESVCCTIPVRFKMAQHRSLLLIGLQMQSCLQNNPQWNEANRRFYLISWNVIKNKVLHSYWNPEEA